MNAVNAATTEAKANTDTKMPITRLQSKKMNAVNAVNAVNAANVAASATTTTTTIKAKQSHGIDFIDASKEWRKNKIKYDNVTFEYIWM
jgi:hypothetical protein